MASDSNMDKVILVRLPQPLDAALRAERQRTGCSVSEFVRRCVCEALNKAAAAREEGRP
jgi:predicted HicB family RNase H-like nuclease